MNRDLYDIIANGNYFTHSIGKINNPKTFEKLESIIKLGGLYSKDKLKKMGYDVVGMVSGHIRITKDIYVSLFNMSNPSLAKKVLSPRFSTFFPIDTDEIVFLIDSSILLQDNAKTSEADCNEIIVKEKVPIDYFFGLIIPNNSECIDFVRNLFKTYDIDIPIYDFEGNTLSIFKKR